jgi:L-threonylcarbamoyladenylate synthase
MILENNKKNIKLFTKKITTGEIVIFPTDTVFGIGCDATNTTAIKKIYQLKQREQSKSLLLNFPSIRSIKKFAHLSKKEEILLKSFSELTLILKVRPSSPLSPLTIKNNTIGVRLPKNKTLLQILRGIKTPLISTSCNKSGNTPTLTKEEAEKIFPQLPILENKEELSQTPSTIIRLHNNEIELLRQGSLSIDDIKNKLQK